MTMYLLGICKALASHMQGKVTACKGGLVVLAVWLHSILQVDSSSTPIEAFHAAQKLHDHALLVCCPSIPHIT